MKARIWLLAGLVFILPGLSQAWWNEDWSFRKRITLDTTAAGAAIQETQTDVTVLVRLHSANFGYFLDVQDGGKDLRFVAGDDTTPLKYHIEKFDPVNGIALIWVKVPRLTGNANAESIWMYYGNESAVDGSDVAGSYDVSQVLVYHFDDLGVPQDKTAYGNHPQQSALGFSSAALIGPGASVEGGQSLSLPSSPSLRIVPASGWSFSTWLKTEGALSQTTVMQVKDGGNTLTLGLNSDNTVRAQYSGAGNSAVTPKGPALVPGQWHHLGLVVTGERLVLFVDGIEASSIPASIPEMGGVIALAAATDGGGALTGMMDEVKVANTARSASWFLASVRSEGMDGGLMVYGGDEANESSGGGHSSLGYVLKKLTFDGLVVMVILAVMSAISWVVMVGKAVVISRAHGDNRKFLRAFRKLELKDAEKLDHKETEEERELAESPLLNAVVGKHDHYQSSPIYRIYHQGIQELQRRVSPPVGAQPAGLTPKSIAAIRAILDAVLVREKQKLNGQMVMLTIAISGGPFIGLLGTVIGVMITFADIALVGDVNINAIAPGMAAALAATVAGLAVAIPALFGYNYLGSRIKNMSADMNVFVDEFISKTAEHYGE